VNRFFNRPFYYNHVWISPDDDELIYSLTSRFQVSRDGGRTLERMPSAGHCFHAMWVDPHNAKRFWQGNDGLYLSFDRGENSLTFKNMNVTQYYAVGVDMRDPYWVCGGLQEAGTSCGLTQDNTGAEHHATIITISQSAIDRDVIWSGTDDGNIHVTRDGGVTWTQVDANITGLPMPDLWVSRVEASHADLGTAYVSIDAHRCARTCRPSRCTTSSFTHAKAT
jgi:hypothetical protein